MECKFNTLETAEGMMECADYTIGILSSPDIWEKYFELEKEKTLPRPTSVLLLAISVERFDLQKEQQVSIEAKFGPADDYTKKKVSSKKFQKVFEKRKISVI